MGGKSLCMIRLDDITPDMDWNRFNRVKEILRKYNIRPLLGVVPDNRDVLIHKDEAREDFWDAIRTLQKEGWAVAQHGTYHLYETDNAGILGINPFSEFAGLSFEKQVEKLREGKIILEKNGICTDIFMAPGHTYDENTLKALNECGFTTITDGLYPRPYYEAGLLCIPCRLRGLKLIPGTDTICLHTNVMDDSDMAEFEQFCKKYREYIVDFEPNNYMSGVKKKNGYVRLYERVKLAERNIKEKIAHSKRLTWYLEKTNHANSKIKWIKRFLCLPLLVCYRNKE